MQNSVPCKNELNMKLSWYSSGWNEGPRPCVRVSAEEPRGGESAKSAGGWILVSPPNSYVETEPQSDSLWRWGLWEVIRSWRCGPYDGISALTRKFPESSVALYTCAERKRRLSMSQEALTKPWIWTCPDLGLLSLQNSEKQISLVYKPLSLWYSGTATKMD